MTSGRLLARNAILNLAGQVAPLLVAVVTIPFLIGGLGTDRFAILSLAWTAIGYFSVFDLGLGWALTQSVARRLGGDEQELKAVTWTALVLMFGLGVVGAVCLAAISPWLVYRVLTVPPTLQAESLTAFHIIALSLPFVVTTAGLRGVVEAHQHFGTSNLLRLPYALFTFIGPLLVLPFSRSLVAVVAVLVAGRLLTWIAFVHVLRSRYTFLRGGAVFRAAVVAPLARYGGWLTVSNTLSPVMSNLDRFVIGAVMPLVAVAHYVTPSEVVIKLLLIPQALNAVLFPAMAAAFGRDPAKTVQIFERGIRLGLLAIFPLVLTLVAFAHEALHLWVGAEFAAAGAGVLRWLAVGILVNAAGQTPYLLLHAAGRTDLTARVHMVELPVYAVTVWLLATNYGLQGVAIAWLMRMALDTGLLMALATRRVPLPWPETQRLAAMSVAMILALVVAGNLDGLVARGFFWLATLLVFGIATWRYIVTRSEREVIFGRLWMGGRAAVRHP
jgi:O-antigen/teichoic acid export membrane protein